MFTHSCICVLSSNWSLATYPFSLWLRTGPFQGGQCSLVCLNP